MAETAEATATEETATALATADQAFEYPVTVENLGPGSKKVSVQIPRQRIDDEVKKQFGELRRKAAIPGFRVGHAPQKLIEKRFASDVRSDVRRSLISESYEQAIEKNKLQVIGEPEFDELDKVQIPEKSDEPLTYTFQVEVQPEFDLPDLFSITVKKPKIDIKEENIDQAMQNLREQQGALVPVEDRGVEEKDILLGDVHVKLGDEVLAHQHDAQLVAKAGRIGGVQIEDLADKVKGLKPSETRTFTITAPENHPDEKARGKELTVEVALKELKKLELAEVTPAFLADLGFENEADLRVALREQMQEKIDLDVQNAMRGQVTQYLLDAVKFEVPEKMSVRQVDRVVQRRAIDLITRGVSQEQVLANIEALKSGAAEEAQTELKLFFILQKLAANLNVDVSEDELNGRIAYIAMQRDQRPETVKKEWAQNGQLVQLYIQMREQKALDKVLETVKTEIVELKGDEKAGALQAEASKSDEPKGE